MKKFFLVSLLIISTIAPSIAQQVLDDVYIREHFPKRRVVPYAPLREADVIWTKRVWRTIDLKEKINHPLYYPVDDAIAYRKSLFRYMKEAALEGNLTLYGGIDEEFRKPLTKDEIDKLFVSWDSSKFAEDPVTGEMVPAPVKNETTSNNIVQYRLKEVWFLDKQRSVMDVRILGICAVTTKLSEQGDVVGVKNLFWVYFPELRTVLANTEVFNRQNDTERLTYDDLFWKRQFNSVIYKVSNVYDRMISEYKLGIDALLEAEDIKNDIFNLEHDLWHF